MKLNRYLIIGRARSGTTLTHLILMGHPQVSALNDELKVKPLFIQGLSTFTFGNDAEKEKEEGMTALFDSITRIRATEFTVASGAKTVVNSPQLAAQLVRNLQKWMPDLRIIHVVRNDLVALFGSTVQGRKSGVMHSWYKDFNARNVDLISVPKFQFYAFAIDSLRTASEVRSLQHSHTYLELDYESLVSDRRALEKRLFEFVELDQANVDWVESEKVLPPPSEYITNYEQAKQWNEDLTDYVSRSKLSRSIESKVMLGRALNRALR